jgi:hypothetical protein
MESRGTSLEQVLERGDYRGILLAVLQPDGLGFANKPKGMIPFHKYPKGPRTAFEEQLIDSIGYVRDKNRKARVHFTLSSQYLTEAKKHIEEASRSFAHSFGTEFDATFSVQKESTDSVAIDSDGNPLRDLEGNLVFRPSGHGALLENLNAIEGDIVFMKTVDNILPERLHLTIAFYKKGLGGLLVKLQEEIFGFLERLSAGDSDMNLLKSTEEFLSETFFHFPRVDGTQKARAEGLRRHLNRPLRVCGVIKHEGEPGGGPFWVSDSKGNASLQIVESAQVDRQKPDQVEIWESSEYFNPVDIVCGLRDFRGRNFDLLQFRDPTTGFVTEKFQEGKSIRALELPGLWNGSMAYWNTVFVEVPRTTFHAVKTVMDLLDEAHEV